MEFKTLELNDSLSFTVLAFFFFLVGKLIVSVDEKNSLCSGKKNPFSVVGEVTSLFKGKYLKGYFGFEKGVEFRYPWMYKHKQQCSPGRQTQGNLL